MTFKGRYQHKGESRGDADSWAQAFGYAMGESLKVINRYQKAAADVKTGAMRGSISFDPPVATDRRVDGVTFAGGTGAPYAKAHEYGTGLFSEAPDSKHQKIVIVPKHAKALAWPNPITMGKPGGPNLRLSGSLRTHVRRALLCGLLQPTQVFVFRQRVVQEGQRPRPYMRKGIEDAWDEVIDYVKEACQKVLGLG